MPLTSKKGFVITPILLIALVLITGILLISFGELDQKIAAGIAKEARLKKALASADAYSLDVGSSMVTYLVKYDVSCGGSRACIETGIKTDLSNTGRSGDVSVSCNGGKINATFSGVFSLQNADVSVNRSVAVSRAISGSCS